jgi:hypothetical protein
MGVGASKVSTWMDLTIQGSGRFCVLTIVLDGAPLITACKFEVQGRMVIDHS